MNTQPVWPVWPNGWVFVYELSGSGFESSCSHLNFRFCTCLKQGVHWHSGNYREWIHSETRTWHDKNIQSNINTLKILQLVKMWKPLLQNTDRCFLFEAAILEHLVFHKSTLQALQMWLKTLWELIFGIVANLQPIILSWLNIISNLARILTTRMRPAKG